MRPVKKWAALALIVVCVVASAQSNPPVAGKALPGLEAFDEAMLATLAKNEYPGGTLAVSYQGRIVLNKAYGFAKKGFTSSTPMAVDQRMRIASMSKWITGVAVLKAAEQGKLNLDQPVAEILAWSQKPADYVDPRVLKITVRHLVQNHAGWVIDRSNDPMFERSPPCPGSAERWASRQKLEAEAGQYYSYSNINFCIAQMALEKATGQGYQDFVKAQIAQPLGLGSWQFATLRGADDEPEYTSSQGQDANPYTNLSFEALGAAGAWTSTSSDYVRFLSAMRGYKGQSLLKPETLSQLAARPASPDSASKPVYYGMGTNIRAMDGGRFNAWHHGSLAGTTSYGASFASGWTIFAVFNRRLTQDRRDAAALDFDRSLSQAIGKSGRPEGELTP